MPTDLTTAINIIFDGIAGVLSVYNNYKPQVWLQLNEAPTDNQIVINNGAFNITATLTNSNIF